MDAGGKRDRFITEAIFRAVKAHLTSLNWFALDDAHAPVTMIDGFPDDDAVVAPNTLAMSIGPSVGVPLEMGNGAEEMELVVFFDFFADSDALGRHLIGDIYAWCKATEYVDVHDYEDDLLPVLFQVEVLDDAEARPVLNPNQKYEKNWRVCSVSISDSREH